MNSLFLPSSVILALLNATLRMDEGFWRSTLIKYYTWQSLELHTFKLLTNNIIWPFCLSVCFRLAFEVGANFANFAWIENKQRVAARWNRSASPTSAHLECQSSHSQMRHFPKETKEVREKCENSFTSRGLRLSWEGGHKHISETKTRNRSSRVS